MGISPPSSLLSFNHVFFFFFFFNFFQFTSFLFCLWIFSRCSFPMSFNHALPSVFLTSSILLLWVFFPLFLFLSPSIMFFFSFLFIYLLLFIVSWYFPPSSSPTSFIHPLIYFLCFFYFFSTFFVWIFIPPFSSPISFNHPDLHLFSLFEKKILHWYFPPFFFSYLLCSSCYLVIYSFYLLFFSRFLSSFIYPLIHFLGMHMGFPYNTASQPSCL